MLGNYRHTYSNTNKPYQIKRKNTLKEVILDIHKNSFVNKTIFSNNIIINFFIIFCYLYILEYYIEHILLRSILIY